MNYELGNLIGKGSDGEVYELIDKESISKKVIKYIQPQITGLRNYLEPYILLHLNHDNIMKADYIELERNGLMKIIQNKADYDLNNKLHNYLVLDTQRLKYMRQLTEAVYYLQRHNIIHGDIKPHNVLLINDNIKLCDFSLAKILLKEPEKSQKHYTITYRAPEVNEGKLYLKSDIWALGCTLYEIYTGFSYFELSKEKKIYHIKRQYKQNLFFDMLISKMITANLEDRYDISEVLPFFNIANIREFYILKPINDYSEYDRFIQKCYSLENNRAMSKKYNEKEQYIANQLKFNVFKKFHKICC